MFEYKIGDYRVKEAEQKMNEMAKEGWRVVTFTPNVAWGNGIYCDI